MKRDISRACLTLGLASTWGVGAATEFYGTVENVTTQGPMAFLYASGVSSPHAATGMINLNTSTSFFPAPGPTPFFAEFIVAEGGGVWGAIGCIDVDRVSLAVSAEDVNSMLGQTWESLFPDFSEASIATAVINGDFTTLSQFADYYPWYFDTPEALGAQATLVDFSNGTFGGYVTLVPEPTAMVALATSSIALLLRRRRS
ncbi:MAG TPA: PEP-CTERM sorting domain-containing protein [Fimbriimonadaceae bacterium]|nr:PEP-CTERM sorting domain-containing protein [Fimbriimonadaceae bacterium]